MESLILTPALEYVAVISVMEKKILEPRLFTRNVIKIFASTSLCLRITLSDLTSELAKEKLLLSA